MVLKLIKTAGPSVKAVSDEEHKLFSRIDLNDDDTIVASLNLAATEYVTDRLEQSLIEETFELFLDRFPPTGCPIEICRTPLISVVKIEYTDGDGNLIVMPAADIQIDNKVQPANIYEAVGTTWPATQNEKINAIKIEFKAGHGAAANDIGDHFKLMIKHTFAHWYEHREPMKDKTWSEIPEHLNALIDKYVIRTFA